MLGLWGWNYLSPDANERAAAMKQLDRGIEFAKQLGADTLVTGTGDLLGEAIGRKTAEFSRVMVPYLDRMELIRISGYTEDEKVEIAKQYLVSKQVEANGLRPEEFTVSDDALRDLVRYYTREAGVRSLEREIANLCRKSIKEILVKKIEKVAITRRNLDKFAGVRNYRFGEAELEDQVGIVTGLAWTEVGGELLQIEAVSLAGKGRVTMTGKLGDVMKESVQAAEMYIKSRAPELGHQADQCSRSKDVHVHVPEGATPKDGPSAGVGMTTAIVSVLTGHRRPQGHRDDRRDHAARPGSADRRLEGEAAGGVCVAG